MAVQSGKTVKWVLLKKATGKNSNRKATKQLQARCTVALLSNFKNCKLLKRAMRSKTANC